MIANKEDKNVVIRPTNIGRKPNEENSFKEEMISTIAEIEIAGIPKIKENFAASRLCHPDIKALEIVTPDLETPGKIANAWEMPIKKLSAKLWFLILIEPLFELSAKNINKVIRNEKIAIDKFERRYLSKK